MKKNSPEFKQLQRDRIYKTKPWEKARGQKTAEGKNRSKMNALKISPKLYYLMKNYIKIKKKQNEIQQKILIHI